MKMLGGFLERQLLGLPAEPFFWPFVFFLPCLLILAAMVYFRRIAAGSWMLRWLGLVPGVIMLTGFAWANWETLTTPAYTDHIQPQVAAVSWYFAEGHPLYHNATAPEAYSMLYGPYLYIITALSEKFLGPTIFFSKFPSIVASGVTLVVLFIVFHKRTTTPRALLASGLYAALMVALGCFMWTVRSDAFLCLFVAIGLWAALSKSKTAPILLGVVIGVCTNLKLHAFVYFLPLLWLAARTGYTRKSWLVAGGGVMVALALPFIALPNVSLANYLWILRGAAGHGLDRSLAWGNLAWAGSAIAVLLGWTTMVWMHNASATREYLRAQIPLFCMMALSLLLVLVPASKIGGGPYHLLPWLMPLLYMSIEMPSVRLSAVEGRSRWTLALSAGVFSWLLCCFWSGSILCYFQIQTMSQQKAWAVSVKTDLNGILQHQGKNYRILMGLGDNNSNKYPKMRPWLVFAGEPIGFDSSALMDLQLGGIYRADLRRLVAAMAAPDAHGLPLLWLIPKGTKPFSVISSYPRMGPLFDDDFRATFDQMFQWSASTEYFDLYTERPVALSPSSSL
jgi:hypothetical protein